MGRTRGEGPAGAVGLMVVLIKQFVLTAVALLLLADVPTHLLLVQSHRAHTVACRPKVQPGHSTFLQQLAMNPHRALCPSRTRSCEPRCTWAECSSTCGCGPVCCGLPAVRRLAVGTARAESDRSLCDDQKTRRIAPKLFGSHGQRPWFYDVINSVSTKDGIVCGVDWSNAWPSLRPSWLHLSQSTSTLPLPTDWWYPCSSADEPLR